MSGTTRRPPGNPPAGSPPWYELLAAIVDALDVPQPERSEDERTARRLLEHRTARLRGYLGSMASNRDEPDIHVGGIRRMTADTPVTYTAWEQPATEPDRGQA